jgi:ABC-type transport system involved in multi-copper enzyme maturation permease subunit
MPLVAALVAKEFQTWLRGRLTFAAFTLLVILVAMLFFLMGLLILAPDANAAPALFSTTSTTATNLLVANRALFLFGAIALCVVLAAAVVAPAVAGSAFAGERERGTMDLLLLQGPSPARIVLGKVVAALFFSLLLLAMTAPFFTPAWSFGGVQPDHVIAFLTVLVTATMLFCALGVFYGAIVRGALVATLLAQGTALFLLFGTLGLYLVFSILGGTDMLKVVLWTNPFLGVLSGGGTVTEAFARGAPAAFRSALSLPAAGWVPGLLVPAWLIGSITWVISSIILIFGAAIAIDPCHPLKGRTSA